MLVSLFDRGSPGPAVFGQQIVICIERARQSNPVADTCVVRQPQVDLVNPAGDVCIAAQRVVRDQQGHTERTIVAKDHCLAQDRSGEQFALDPLRGKVAAEACNQLMLAATTDVDKTVRINVPDVARRYRRGTPCVRLVDV